MPSQPKRARRAAEVPDLNIPKELLDQLVSGPMSQGSYAKIVRELLPPLMATADQLSRLLAAK